MVAGGSTEVDCTVLVGDSVSSTANTQLLKYPLVDGVRATSHVAYDIQGSKGSAKYSSQFEVGSVSQYNT